MCESNINIHICIHYMNCITVICIYKQRRVLATLLFSIMYVYYQHSFSLNFGLFSFFSSIHLSFLPTSVYKPSPVELSQFFPVTPQVQRHLTSFPTLLNILYYLCTQTTDYGYRLIPIIHQTWQLACQLKT